VTAPATLPRTFYDAYEVAESTGLTYRQVVALTKSGEIPSRTFGRYIRIPAWWVDENREKPA
jgi:excisionase family DNA binding protein